MDARVKPGHDESKATAVGMRHSPTGCAAHFTTAGREFHKRKAAGWGPGGSRTSAIVSGGWECDRRR
jgi:hypothetical protein